ncbi:MAG: C_GCAxxG_C_C family protein [Firmicutes bacterium]|nr:C_GCAxxG_C_C family protein [Bacillota bacterium]
MPLNRKKQSNSGGEEYATVIPKLVKWFKEEYQHLNCEEILAGNELKRMLKCPKMLMATYDKTMELLEDYGY